jgi:ribonucleoside-diphosphate reductase alpha chain
MNLEQLKQKDLAPVWMTEESLSMLSNGYLLENETPRDMWQRVSKASADRLKKPELASLFFEMFWKGWVGGASPVLSNMGTNRGLPISCFSNHLEDSVSGIFKKQHELAMLSKSGGGVGIYMGDIRARGASISGNGKSEGIIPWAKCFDATTLAVSQGGVRKGASALYLPFSHGDIDEFIDIRRPTGDVNRRVAYVHNAVTLTDNDMEGIVSGDKLSRERWKKILQARVELGEPYLLFTDNVNNNNPECYKHHNLLVKTSNICNEIVAYTDKDHTFVCCLSSIALAKFDEYENYIFSNGMNLPELLTWFLDGVLQEFIDRADGVEGYESAVRFAKKSRMLGVGVMGWHTLLQQKNLPFDSFQSMMLNSRIFSFIKNGTHKASRDMAKEYGEPEWCKGFGMRNTHTMAVAPTVSNAAICGGDSSSIEPITSNAYALKGAKGVFIRKNRILENLLETLGKNTVEVWDQIIKNQGSVDLLPFLSKEEKDIFKTAREINQFAIINQASQRQQFIDQSQSVNLFFTSGSSSKYINEVHLEAWKKGLKGLYYLRSETVLKGTVSNFTKDECASCEG